MRSLSSLLSGLRHRRALVLALAALAVGPAFAGAEPASPSVALAYDAATSTILRAEGEQVTRSTDEGMSWQPVGLPPMLAKAPIAAIAIAAQGSAIYLAGPGLGVLRGDAEGRSWKAVGDTLPSRDVTALAAHTTQPDTLYAYLPEQGIYRSQDAGQSWKLMDQGPDGIRQLIHSDLAGSMESGWLYATTAKGASVSMDCFCLWRDLGEFTGPVTSVAYQPGLPDTLYAASEGRIFRSTDGGRSWQQAPSPEATVAALTVAPSGTLYAATVDGGFFRSVDGAASWSRVGA